MVKRVPMRMCTGCREMKPKAELVRVVKSPEGVVALDLVGKVPGRGAYVCRSVDCLKRSRKSRALERVFKGPVSAELEAQLIAQMEGDRGE
ncbi:MAG: YlxR family protein [Oscillospiraceae bacterium]|nr:YlxR family protein [Oscillospiraceae bacterium]